MRADRLLLILSLLQEHGRLSSRELAERLEISERTVHRDMEALSAAGIPVYSERGANGGWLLSEGYRSHMTGMTTGEIRSLLLLQTSSVVKDLGLNDQVQAALRKLLAALPSAARQDAEYVRERIHIDGAGWHTAAPSRDTLLRTVQEAVWEQRLLRISYRGWDAEEDTDRVVRPLGLVAKLGVWYMVAKPDSESPSDSDADFRTYRLSRLQEATRLEQVFTRPEVFDLAAYWNRSTERFKANLPRYQARIRIATARWDEFSRERFIILLSSDPVQSAEWTEAEVEFNTEEYARKILLGYGRHAEALAPDSLRDSIIEESCAVSLLYKKGKSVSRVETD
ncbi:WYL domain-containing protein [Cohnella endophytica]|uniref:WYL domain-containing protein n=1 Tax=Cohnella endophytica TaxID=2419778 RepID=A0A494XGY1_9BACL|nr:WYL domain-containing protein [Cohnella endophytica]RKP47354.1 WYL domain-containing protein [Cohnella endophytica]